MKIRPLNDRILVLRIEEEEKTEGGIIVPDTAKEKPQKGNVIAVGPGLSARAIYNAENMLAKLVTVNFEAVD